MASIVFFRAEDSKGDYGLWETNGTVSGTFEVGGLDDAGVLGALSNGGLEPLAVTALGSELLFSASAKIGTTFSSTLWVSNGTAGGTYNLGGASGIAGASSGGLDPVSTSLGVAPYVTFGNKALFIGYDTNEYEGLWVTDGTAAGTTEIGGLNNAGISGKYYAGLDGAGYTAVGNEVFFNGLDTDDDHGLWVTNGTASGTFEIGGIGDAGVAGVPSGGLNPSSLFVLGNELVFNSGGSLWISNGTAAGTIQIAKNITAYSNVIAVLGSNAFFLGSSSSPSSGLGLFVTNGTASGTSELGGSNNAGIAGSASTGLNPDNLTVFGSKILFEGEDSGGALGVWVTDGTAAGTVELGGLKDQGITGVNPAGLEKVLGDATGAFVAIGTKVLFTGYDASGQICLWVTDGTTAGTSEIGGINNAGVSGANVGGLDPTSFTVSGQEAFFDAKNSSGQTVLWVSNGTASGTYQITSTSAYQPTGLDATELTVVNLSNSPNPVIADFSGAGNSDVVWRDTSGDVALWEPVANSTSYTSVNLGNVSTDWQIAGVGDFTSSGLADIVWRNTNGNVAIWETNPSGLSYTSVNPGYVSTDWQIQQVGDFTGSGEDSILWRNTNGDVTLWNPNAGSNTFTSQDLGYVSTDWQIQQAGDFNGDGRDGVLWRNSNTGDVTLWNATASGTFTSQDLGAVSSNWKIAGVGDFTGNGQDDILWRNSTSGDVALWEPNATASGYSSVDLGIVSTDWQITSVGDYNGDGKADILWRNANSGDVTIWNSNSNSLTFTAKDMGAVSANWHITNT